MKYIFVTGGVVGSLYPDWQAARGELKQRAASLPIL